MKRNQRKRQWEETSEKGSDKRSSTKRQKIAEPSMGMKSTESEMLDAAHPNDEKPATKGKSTSVDVVKLEKPKEEGVESERLEDEGVEMEKLDDETDYDEDPEEDPEEEPMEDEEMQDANPQDEARFPLAFFFVIQFLVYDGNCLCFFFYILLFITQKKTLLTFFPILISQYAAHKTQCYYLSANLQSIN